jgi:hypothetical protein
MGDISKGVANTLAPPPPKKKYKKIYNLKMAEIYLFIMFLSQVVFKRSYKLNTKLYFYD